MKLKLLPRSSKQLPLTFPSNTSMALNWSTRVAVDTSSGVVVGSSLEEVSIKSVYSGKCMDVSSASMADNANILQYTCSKDYNQKWRFKELAPGEWQIKALHSSRCMDVASGSSDNGANLLQYACNGANNQRFRKQYASDGSFSLVAKQGGKCVEVADAAADDGGDIRMWTCSGKTNQLWTEAK